MKVLVTGGSGFIGSHIADALSDAGHDVVLFDLKPSSWLRADQAMVTGNVLDPAAVDRAMAGCEAVYHLAALADINEALDRPRETVEINIVGTLNLLEAARVQKVKRFIFASSIYVYSNQGSFYRTTKQTCENLIGDYHDRYGLEFTTLRFGSLYGPRAGMASYLNCILSQALNERRIDYYGTGEEVREYIHVLDAAAMSVDVLAPEFANQYMHLTGRERITSRDMLAMIREMLGSDVVINLNATSPVGHYVQTPYHFAPKLGRRLARNSYIDLGLGLMDCLQHIGSEHIDASPALVKKEP
jgi:UDP-glucose 4-epimerase